MLTRRDNLLRLLRGEKPKWTPCALNVWQWHTHHKNFNQLPPELVGTNDRFDAMKVLGCDIFVRTWAGIHLSPENVAIERRHEPGAVGPRHVVTVHTPHGDLRSIDEEQSQFTSTYRVEDPVKDWDRDRRAFLWYTEQLRSRWDRDAFVKIDQRIGADGLVLASLPPTPLKYLHQNFGLDHACLFLLDHPEDAKRICDLYWERFMPVLRQLAADPQVVAACFEDNVDTPFYPPGLIEEYWVPYVRQAADLFHASGKRILVHACGKLHQLMPAFRAAAVDGLDGMAHPPLGDWTLADAHAMGPAFIYDGGFSAHEQVTKSDDDVHRFYEDFFPRVRDLPAFVFAAACQTAITTRWERIKLVLELCRQHAGRPDPT